MRYEYDVRGDLVAVTDRDDNTTQFVYRSAAAHYLEQVIDPLGRTGVRTEYDAQGRLHQVIDAAGNPVQFVYDPANSLETVTDALGNTTTSEYDARGNILTRDRRPRRHHPADVRRRQQQAHRDRPARPDHHLHL